MEEILEEVKKYEASELRKRLIDVGVDVGPITPYSISIFQKRLAKKLFELGGGKLEEPSEEKQTKNNETVKSTDSKEAKPVEARSSVSDVFYAICMPEDIDESIKNEVGQLVFSDKDLAFKTAKKIKNSRFKMFKSESDAREFSKLTAETAFNSPRKPSIQNEEQPEKQTTPVAESSPYKSPKSQELIVLRRAIENGNAVFFKKCVWDNPRYLVGSGDTPTIYQMVVLSRTIESGNAGFFKKCVWDNPRYLVGSGDTPTIYQEGFRYTAMHVAAMKNKPDICQVILDTVENPEFITQLYSQSKQSEETQNSRISFLVDFYLNMPDKGNCESPLHMACKFGFDKVVEVLVSHPKTDRKLKNKYGDSPRDVICTRCNGASSSLKERIEMLLEGRSYVPLLRSDDNSTAPMIGRPWSPDKNSPIQNKELGWSPKDPSMSVKAYAGPMSPSNAKTFHKRWTTPPPQSPDQAKQYLHIKRSDSEKGLERIGRQLAHEMKIPWLEYWEFLNAYIDISSDSGLELLEKYLQKTIWLEYIKTFKDKNNIDREPNNFTTPVKTSKKGEDIQNKENVSIEGKVQYSNDNKDSDHIVNLDDLKENPDKIEAKDSTVLSPMSSLAQRFARIKLLDESWSDKATVDSLNQSNLDENSNQDEGSDRFTEVEDEKYSKNENGALIQPNACDKVDLKDTNIVEKEPEQKTHEESVLNEQENGAVIPQSNCDKTDNVQNNCKDEKDSRTDVKENSNNDKEVVIKVSDSTIKDCRTEESKNETSDKEDTEKANKTEDLARTVQDGIAEQNQDHTITQEVRKFECLRQRSTSTESNDSFKTTAESVADPDIAAFHDLDEIDNHVCVNLSDGAIVNQLRDHLKRKQNKQNKSNSNDNNQTCMFLVRLKTLKVGLKVDIVSLPRDDVYTCSDLLMLENVDVSSCEGDIGATEEGEVIEIGSGDSKATNDESGSPVYGYLSRAVTLPKVSYLYGPQPTREDLDVSRALGEVIIVPDLYPNVFQWKIRLAKFVKDTNYRWQSPAKVRTKLQHGSPVPSPLRKSSPVIQYGSPLGLQSPQRVIATSDIRTRLFPAISE